GASAAAALRAAQLLAPVALLAIGGYVSRVGYDEHAMLGPQLAGLLCVSVLWLSVVAQPESAARARAEREKRALHDVVADGGDNQRDGQGGEQGAQERPGQLGPARDPVDLFKYERMP